jgi:hypothetical protein
MKNLTINRKSPIYKSFFLPVAIGVFLFNSCLNPITGEYEIPPIPVQGEITVDNINSSELQFINHTKSMDIVKVEITRFYEDPGQSGIKTNLDGRLLGGPHAGTRESLLVRPIGETIYSPPGRTRGKPGYDPASSSFNHYILGISIGYKIGFMNRQQTYVDTTTSNTPVFNDDYENYETSEDSEDSE